MKLISVQSLENRIAEVHEFTSPGIAGRHVTYCLDITADGKVILNHHEDYHSDTWALIAAEQWLQEAKQ